MFRGLPEPASEFASRVDQVNNVITDISVFFTIAIVGAMLYFAVRYRRRGGVDHETPQIEGNVLFEIIWTVVPTIICIFVAAYGYIVFDEMRKPPKDALEVQVTAQKWSWSFEYENGKKTGGYVVVPVDKPVKFVMTSRDVLHSFFVPSMRVKSDVIPKQYTMVWFQPIKTGEYQVYCTEYCGTNHWNMLAKVRVVSQAEFDRWLADTTEEARKSEMSPSERGEILYRESGCVGCHTTDGSYGVGPTFLELYGRQATLDSGDEYTADENYIKRSMLEPNKEIVAGYSPNQMPSQDGQLTDDEITSLIAFIKSLDGTKAAATKKVKKQQPVKVPDTPEGRGELVYEAKLCNSCHSLDGSKLVGPTFKGLIGRQGVLSDGTSYTADGGYVRESIHEPAKKVVQGYAPMPPLAVPLNKEELADLMAFLETVN